MEFICTKLLVNFITIFKTSQIYEFRQHSPFMRPTFSYFQLDQDGIGHEEGSLRPSWHSSALLGQVRPESLQRVLISWINDIFLYCRHWSSSEMSYCLNQTWMILILPLSFYFLNSSALWTSLCQLFDIARLTNIYFLAVSCHFPLCMFEMYPI